MAASHSSDHLLSGPLADHLNALAERAPTGRLLFLHEPLLHEPTLHQPCSTVAAWLASQRQRTQSNVESLALELPFDFSSLHPRYQLCIIFIDLTSLQSGGSIECLARIKHQFCNHIELIVQNPGRDPSCDDPGCDKEAQLTLDKILFGLGFKHTTGLALPSCNLECYAYELHRYNKKRSWNSPEYWANPQNFNKFRW